MSSEANKDFSVSMLVVDDSRLMRDMIAFALNEAGYSDIETAEDGIDALEKSETREYDLVVTDINMPRMDGFEFCQNLKNFDYYKDIPVIVLTTESSDKMKRKGQEVGAAAWLIKPFVPAELIYVVETLLAKNR